MTPGVRALPPNTLVFYPEVPFKKMSDGLFEKIPLSYFTKKAVPCLINGMSLFWIMTGSGTYPEFPRVPVFAAALSFPPVFLGSLL